MDANERIKELERQLDEARKELSASKVEGKVWTLARENGVPEHAISDVVNRASGNFMVVSGKLVHNDGFGFYSWLNGLKANAPHLFGEAGGNGDGQGSESATGKRRGEMTPAEKAQFIGEHGIDKFMGLPQ